MYEQDTFNYVFSLNEECIKIIREAADDYLRDETSGREQKYMDFVTLYDVVHEEARRFPDENHGRFERIEELRKRVDVAHANYKAASPANNG